MSTVFCCLNEAPDLLDEHSFKVILAAAIVQNHDDFAPAWNLVPATFFIWAASDPLPGQHSGGDRFVPCYFRRATAEERKMGALAYHWVRPETGQPEVVVLVDVILGEPGATLDDVIEAFGHEVIETEGDKFGNDWSDRGDGWEEAKELVDRVQGYSYTKVVAIDGKLLDVRVTDFLLPEAFDDQASPGAQFDWCGRLKSAREIGDGAYASVRKTGSGEREVFGSLKAAAAFSGKTLERHGHDVAAIAAKLPSSPTLGQVAYEAYGAAARWRSLANGAPLPRWGKLHTAIREAWEVAAAAVKSAPAAPATTTPAQALDGMLAVAGQPPKPGTP